MIPGSASPLLLESSAGGSTEYQIKRSLRFRADTSAYLERTPSVAGDRKKWTWSGWVKRGTLATAQYLFSAGTTSNDLTFIGFSATDQLDTLNNIAGLTVARKQTTTFYRDPSAWYHIVVAYDMTHITDLERISVYVNGVELTAFGINNASTMSDTQVNSAILHRLGNASQATTVPFDGYLSEVNFIDGQALTPASFGQIDATTGVWSPIAYTGVAVPAFTQFPDAAPADPAFSDVVLLVHANGTNGSSSFVDNSSSNRAVTTTGGVTVSSTQSRFGGTSASFNGSTGYLGVAPGAYADLGTISTSTNATIEAWIYPSAVTAGLYQTIVTHALPGSAGSGIGGWNLRLFGGAIVIAASANSNAVNPWFAIATTADVIAANTWAHVAVVITSGVLSIFVNGVSTPYTYSTGALYQPTLVGLNTTRTTYGLRIGASDTDSFNTTAVQYFSGFIDDLRITIGTARYSTTFYPNGYNPYGTNGFYLDFSDPSSTTNLCLDRSGNANNWTPSGISVTAGSSYDSMLDVPTRYSDGGNGRGNYATFFPIMPNRATGPLVTSQGNMFAYCPPHVGLLGAVAYGTMAVASGKWYWESTYYRSGTLAGYYPSIGVIDRFSNISPTDTNNVSYRTDGRMALTGLDYAYGAAYDNGDNIGVAIDSEAGTIEFYKNGVPQGLFAAPFTVRIPHIVALTSNAFGSGYYINFGQRPFAYTPPTGYLALHTGNLPAPAITKPNAYFDATLYTGSQTSFGVPVAQYPDSVAGGDAYYNSVALLLHGNGVNGGTVFPDNSPIPKTPTLVGSPTTTNQAKFGGGSITVSTGGALVYTNSADLYPGTSDFTIECWVYKTSTTVGGVIYAVLDPSVANSTAIKFGIPDGAYAGPYVYMTVGGVTYGGGGSRNVFTTVWTHLAMVKSGLDVHMFVGGILHATYTLPAHPMSSTRDVWVGADDNGAGSFVRQFTGHIDDLRVTKGVSRLQPVIPAKTVTNSGGMQPDLVWIKSRSAATDHKLTDSVRGVTKALSSNLTDAGATDTNGLTAFSAGGFTLGTDDMYNTTLATYVAWQWKASGAAAVSNTAGSITSQVSVNASSGFSIVTYTGTGVNATVGHGLGVAPKFYIVKSSAGVGGSWACYHVGISAAATKPIYLNLTNAAAVDALMFNSTDPTSSVFSLGTAGTTNNNLATYVAYCFSEIEGFSKFGSYTGNGAVDGPFVYCGFRPKFILVKRSDALSNWDVLDSSRDTANMAEKHLAANALTAEISSAEVDLLATGFKLRTTGTTLNASASTLIFMAFAENPLKYALAR